MTVKDAQRSVTTAQVMETLQSLPKAQAAGQAIELYTAASLARINDKVLRRQIAVSLADHFKGVSHPGLPRALALWETYR